MTKASLLETAGLGRAFGGLQAVSELSFSVRQGRIKAVIGPNGAGKTTLFNMIAGVTPPSEGTIVLEGERIDALPSHRRVERGIARTFQNLLIFKEMTVLENVMVGRHVKSHCDLFHALFRTPASVSEERAIRDRSMALLERVGLRPRANEAGSSLSFGEGKLLEVARALATEPRLLLLDEPAAGLNRAEADRLGATIRALNSDGLTLLLVEHNMHFVMSLADEILVMDHGRRIAEGPPDLVRKDPAVLAAYLGEDEDA